MRLATTTDPAGRTDSLFYDGADRLIRQVLPGGREIAFAYDSSGNLTSVTPPSQPGGGAGFGRECWSSDPWESYCVPHFLPHLSNPDRQISFAISRLRVCGK